MSPITIIDETEAIETTDSDRALESREMASEAAPSRSESDHLVVTEQETSLDEILGDRGLDPRLAAAVVRDVARQVHILHKHGLPHGRISAANVSAMSSGSVDHSFMTWRGPIAAIAVTADAWGSPIRSAASDAHGVFSSSSAMQ